MGSVVQGALSAIDIALWDIKGKRLGVPIHDLLGGRTRDRARCYMHVAGDTADDLAPDARAKVDASFRGRPLRSVRAGVLPLRQLLSVGGRGGALDGWARCAMRSARTSTSVWRSIAAWRLRSPSRSAAGWSGSARILLRRPDAAGQPRGDGRGARALQPADRDRRAVHDHLRVPAGAGGGRRRLRASGPVSVRGDVGMQAGWRQGRGPTREGDPAQPAQHRCLRAARRLHPELRAAGEHRRVRAAEERPADRPLVLETATCWCRTGAASASSCTTPRSPAIGWRTRCSPPRSATTDRCATLMCPSLCRSTRRPPYQITSRKRSLRPHFSIGTSFHFPSLLLRELLSRSRHETATGHDIRSLPWSFR